MIPYSVARLRGKVRKQDSGKFKQSRCLGVSVERGYTHAGWLIEVSKSRVGVTVRRDVFSVSIRDEEGSLVHRLSGFTRRDQALVASRNWIDQAQALLAIRIDREHRLQGMRALKSTTRRMTNVENQMSKE